LFLNISTSLKYCGRGRKGGESRGEKDVGINGNGNKYIGANF